MIDFSNNLDALSTLLNLNNISSQISLSTQRLSSGLRINSPADDPSGFVTANALQLQVDGLNQAVQSTQNSSNLLKTATSALAQINTLISTIRSSAQDAAANGQSNPAQASADQQTILNAISSINNIAATTAFGNKSLLNGSAGTTAALTDAVRVGGINFGSSFGGGITQAGAITVTVNTAATQATITGTVTYASAAALVSSGTGGSVTGGTLTLNGQAISVAGSDTVQTLLNKINAVESATGVNATFSGGKVVLTQSAYGANFKINLSSTAAVVAGAGSSTAAGTDAAATVSAQALAGGVTTTTTATFTGGRSSTDSGLRLTDTDGNSILLTGAGNIAGTYTVGSIASNPASFQIGAGVGQTASVSLPNVFASNLGTTSLPGLTLAGIDVTTQVGANNALIVATEAANQVSQYAAQLGSFQKNVLDSASNVLQIASQNIQASISSIRDVDIAAETANLARLQVIQQAGISVLHSAISTPALYLRLLS